MNKYFYNKKGTFVDADRSIWRGNAEFFRTLFFYL